MLAAIGHCYRLARAGLVLARHVELTRPDLVKDAPGMVRFGFAAIRILAKLKPFRTAARTDTGHNDPLNDALCELGPSYIKLGQFLATRPDLAGQARARALMALQDTLEPFSQDRARGDILENLGADSDDVFSHFGPPVAAASIAQVHKAHVGHGEETRAVAVKILRPGIERRFARDLDDFFFAARQLERWHAPSRRLKPVEAVAMLARSMTLEMDLRMEAAALSEMAENSADDAGFQVPAVDWSRTSRRVLTTEWIDAIPLSATQRIHGSAIDLPALGDRLIQIFLRHAIRDGFFHADMHQGNLFVDTDGCLIAVDFGIMGRLSLKERKFLAEILYGFATRDYMRVSQVHFEAGYVPHTHSPAMFAQALRAIGEPLMDKPASEISMAMLLTQLFQVTEQFDMQTQTQLLLLQKTMVVVEGVARTLNPALNMWQSAEPVLRQWVEHYLGPQGRIEDAAESAAALGRLASALPDVLAETQRAARAMAVLSEGRGAHPDAGSADPLTPTRARSGNFTPLAVWVGALALVVLALTNLF